MRDRYFVRLPTDLLGTFYTFKIQCVILGMDLPSLNQEIACSLTS